MACQDAVDQNTWFHGVKVVVGTGGIGKKIRQVATPAQQRVVQTRIIRKGNRSTKLLKFGPEVVRNVTKTLNAAEHMAGVSPHGDDVLIFRETIDFGRDIAMHALECAHFEKGRAPFIICQYGTGEGKNDIDYTKEFVACIKAQHGLEQQVLIVYEDLPQNDFTGLFTGLHDVHQMNPEDESGASRYAFGYDDVAIMTVGRSFYSQCSPAGFVHFGFSQRAMHRLSMSPCTLSDGLMHMYASSELERKKFSDQAATDWENILLQRAKELAPGGQFAVALNADTDKRDFYIDKGTFCHYFSLLNKTWRKMLHLGRISEEEFRNTNVNLYGRTQKELKEPFDRPGSPVLKAGLRLVEMCIKYLPGPLEEERKRLESNDDGDWSSKASYASRMVHMTRLWFGGALLDGLSVDRSPRERETLVEEAFTMFGEIVAISPQNYTLARYYAIVHVEKVHQ